MVFPSLSAQEDFAGSDPRDRCDAGVPIAPGNRRFSGNGLAALAGGRDQSSKDGALRATGATATVRFRLCFESLVRITVRRGAIGRAVRGAVWTEIDTDDRVWTIQATRAKVEWEQTGPAVPAGRADPSTRRGRLVMARTRSCSRVWVARACMT